ncbi:MAG: hypothetical protein WBE22_09830 [Halobacteriota archaeon]
MKSAKIGVKNIYFILFYSAVSELTFWWEGDKRIGIGQRALSAKKNQSLKEGMRLDVMDCITRVK